jgi:uncharacterized protein YcbK (DUF882 family)
MSTYRWNRRAFLKTALAGALLVLTERPLLASIPAPERYPDGRLTLLNTHNKERLTVTFRNANGDYDPSAINELNRVLRCHYTDEQAKMDLRVIEYLNYVDKELGGDNEIHIISGYRSPAYNSLLRKNGRHVARNSLHMKGMAIDFSLPHVGLEKIRRCALNLRYGGVGYYPGGGFVHIDSGSFRTW